MIPALPLLHFPVAVKLVAILVKVIFKVNEKPESWRCKRWGKDRSGKIRPIHTADQDRRADPGQLPLKKSLKMKYNVRFWKRPPVCRRV